MSGDDEHVDECTHATVLRNLLNGVWRCAYCNETFVQSFRLHSCELMLSRAAGRIADGEIEAKAGQLIEDIADYFNQQRVVERLNPFVQEPPRGEIVNPHVIEDVPEPRKW